MIQIKRALLLIAAVIFVFAGKVSADDKAPASTTPTAKAAGAPKSAKSDSPTMTAMKAAIALEDAGNTTAAVAAFEKIGVLKSTNMEAWRLNDEAHVYIIAGDFKKAVELLEKATQANDKNFMAWNNLGTTYEQNGDLDKAKDAYQKSIDAAKAADASAAKAQGNLDALQARLDKAQAKADKKAGKMPAATPAAEGDKK
jgi:tetratricopeptide (TPR) repeat protein